MIKNILLILVGMMVGLAVGAGGFFLINKQVQTILPAPIDDLGILDNENESIEIIKTSAAIEPLNLQIPKTLVTAAYHSSFELIVNSINQVGKINNTEIYPTMQVLKDMSRTGNWEGIFEVMKDIKVTIQEIGVLLAKIENTASVLRTQNNSTTNEQLRQNSEVFASATIRLSDAYSSYLETLSKFLTGTPPTAELATELNAKIALVNTSNVAYQSSFDGVYKIISAEISNLKSIQTEN